MIDEAELVPRGPARVTPGAGRAAATSPTPNLGAARLPREGTTAPRPQAGRVRPWPFMVR